MAGGGRPIEPVKRALATSHGIVTVVDNGVAAPAVLLIHGNSSCWRAFAPLFDSDLAGRYRMIAFDLPGHGESADAADPEHSCNIPAYADVALEVLSALGIDRAAILGWSLGGHVGLEIMARWPGLRGLMIVGTPPVAPDPAAIAGAFIASPLMEFAGREDLSPDEAEAYIRAACGPEVDRFPALLAAARRTDGRARRCMMSQALAGAGADGRRVAETCDIPLAVVVGAGDPFVERNALLSVEYASLWRGEVHVMAQCGHAPFLDRPAEFNKLLDSFLGGIPL